MFFRLSLAFHILLYWKIDEKSLNFEPFRYGAHNVADCTTGSWIKPNKESTMKVLLHYEDNENKELWKSLKITLPKSWKTGPTSQLLQQFVETYNSNESLGGGPNPLNIDTLHLSIPGSIPNGAPAAVTGSETSTTNMIPIACDAIVVDSIADRADVYIMHGPSQTVQQLKEIQDQLENERKQQQQIELEKARNMVSCTRFGCQRRFPKGGPYPSTPPCQYHRLPPVFHETAKFWSCCPNKKVYDFDDFQQIPGCCEAPTCTESKENQDQPLFLGGTDLREKNAEAVKLKSIDDFNKSQAAGGSDAAPVLERLQSVLSELDIDKELYDQVIDLYRSKLQSQTSNDVELLAAIKLEIGTMIKSALKAAVVDHMRIK